MGVNLLKKDEGLLFSITSNFFSIWGQLSYLLARSENARQPQCTPEKEDAIMQAFRHFGII